MIMIRYFYTQDFYLQNLTEIFRKHFMSNREIHNYNTRNSSLLHRTSNRTNYRKHTLANKGIEVWNNRLPKQYKKSRKNNIKTI
jgi:hypothetical protein